jgi:hypothetical protein
MARRDPVRQDGKPRLGRNKDGMLAHRDRVWPVAAHSSDADFVRLRLAQPRPAHLREPPAKGRYAVGHPAARPIGRDPTVIRGAAACETRKMERATRSAVSAAAFFQALDACAAHFTEARIAEPRAFGLLAPAPPGCEPKSSPAPSRRARHRCARGSTIRCLGIEVVAASSNSSRQTLARKG